MFKKTDLLVATLLLNLTATPSLAAEKTDNNEALPDKDEIKSKPQKKAIQETVLGMNVSGNKEAPNLLYIIPWKDNSDNSKPPEVYRLMDEIYSTVDPDVFEKEVVFFGQLVDKSSKKDDK